MRQTCFLLLAAAPLVHAQSRATPLPDLPASSFGIVSGHITVSGSNAPARFAKVALQPVEIQPEDTTFKAPLASYSIFQTDLDGGYTIPHVSPGKYFLVVTAPGYLSPFDRFTHAELEHPSLEVQQPSRRC